MKSSSSIKVVIPGYYTAALFILLWNSTPVQDNLLGRLAQCLKISSIEDIPILNIGG